MTTLPSIARGGALAAVALVAGLSAQPAQALSAAICEQIAETADGVYDLAIKNGEPVATAKARAQRTFMRRVAAEGGPAPSTMPDDINDCVAAGMGRAKLTRMISAFYP